MTTTRGKISYIPISWTSDGSGDATVAIPDYRGFLFKSLKTWPSSDPAPTTHTVTLIDDETGGDILVGEGADRSGTAADAPIIDYAETPIPGALTYTVAGAGDSKEGHAVLALKAT
ncbi:MAG: hypothetical protein JJW03_00215 [Desulfosarcina sp.]|nr:hypothetical protein [Desulfobacterales bacterium]